MLLKLDDSQTLYRSISKTRQTYLKLIRYLFVQSSVGSLEKRREKISKQLAEQLDFTVRYGPFKGLRLSTKFNWGKSDVVPMLLGTYEQSILDYLSTRRNKIRNFINLGAGDGYYVAGMLFSGLARYAYEMNKSSRELI